MYAASGMNHLQVTVWFWNPWVRRGSRGFFIEPAMNPLLGECRFVLPPAMCRRRRMFDMLMHLRNFRQVFIEEVRQVMTRSAFGRQKFRSRQKQWRCRWKMETIAVTHPLWKISGYATVSVVCL